jgi:SMC interacting uncharacterized protein involved in chromosome segregation
VQAWFLGRSRDNWKDKYMELKADRKRLQNRVRDVSESRELWRGRAEESARRVAELEAEIAALQQQSAALKKDGPGTDALGPGR